MAGRTAEETGLVTRVRTGWEALAAGASEVAASADGPPSEAGPRSGSKDDAAATPAGRFAERLELTVSPGSLLCPPGWIGIVAIDSAVLATAPDPATARTVRNALASVPPAHITDPETLTARLPVVNLLGPASLAYLLPAKFRAAGDFRAAAGSDVTSLSTQDASLVAFLAETEQAERGESGLDEITSPAFAFRQSGRVLSAAGYRRWPNGFAHLCVLTAADARGRGLARLVSSAAVGHALAAGLLPQWRARIEPSIAVARSLGFTELGAQVSLRIDQG